MNLIASKFGEIYCKSLLYKFLERVSLVLVGFFTIHDKI